MPFSSPCKCHFKALAHVTQQLSCGWGRTNGMQAAEADKWLPHRGRKFKILEQMNSDAQGSPCVYVGRGFAAATTATAENYMNRYRNAWGAATAAARQLYDDALRRRGGRATVGRAAVPLAELAVPVPLSRFVWPLVR